MPMALRLPGIHTGAGDIVNERKVKHLYALGKDAEDDQPLSIDKQKKAENEQKELIEKYTQGNGAIVIEHEVKHLQALEMDGEDDQPLLTDYQNEAENEKKESNEIYSMPLVWIDLEMTGQNVQVDRILEIACIITDGNLTKTAEGPDLVIHQSEECLEKMEESCQKNHAASGLIERVLLSTVTEREAEEQVIEFVKRHVRSRRPHLAGNSVYMDFIFLKKHMLKLAAMFSPDVVDVKSVKNLCIRWYLRENQKAPKKKRTNRAMDDIKDSIEELKYFRLRIFNPKKRNL